MFQYFKYDDDDNSEIKTPYHKAHLENGYDALLIGLDGNVGSYKLIIFNDKNVLIHEEKLKTTPIDNLKTLYDLGNAHINMFLPRINVIKEAVCYLDRLVVKDAELWASMTRQLRIIEAKLKKNK